MAIRKIVTSEDNILIKISRPVEKFDERLWTLLDDMKDTMYKANGVGLAAVQVGVLRRALVMDTGVEGESDYLELINPEIISEEGEQITTEGCLSFPDESGITRRPMTVKVKAQDRNGKWYIYKGEGLKAKCFCHEIDHLNGIVYKQHIVKELENK